MAHDFQNSGQTVVTWRRECRMPVTTYYRKNWYATRKVENCSEEAEDCRCPAPAGGIPLTFWICLYLGIRRYKTLQITVSYKYSLRGNG